MNAEVSHSPNSKKKQSKKLGSALPPAANLYNPIDVLGDAIAERYSFALSTALDDPNVDIVLILLTPQAMTEAKATAEAIVKISKEKPAKAYI